MELPNPFKLSLLSQVHDSNASGKDPCQGPALSPLSTCFRGADMAMPFTPRPGLRKRKLGHSGLAPSGQQMFREDREAALLRKSLIGECCRSS